MPDRSLKIDTSTHALTFFPNSVGESAYPAYFILAQRRRPELAVPQELLKRHELKIEHTNAESNTLSLLLAGDDIGDYDNSSDQAAINLADFVANWRAYLSSLDSAHPSRKPSVMSLESGLSDTPESTLGSHDRRLNGVLQRHASEFIFDSTLSMRIMTWNMHGESLAKQRLDLLLGLPVMADLYVLGLQESDVLGPRNLYANTATLENTKRAILAALGDGYTVVASNQLLGLMQLVFAADKVAAQVSMVMRDTTGTGLLGVWGNKGAACIWLNIGVDPSIPDSGTELILVNCHLSAGDSQASTERRKWELGEIAKNMGIDGLVNRDDIEEGQMIFDSDAKIVDEVSDMVDAIKLANSKIVFVMGDLNYRVTMDADMVKDFADRQDYETIIVQDQLKHSIKDDHIFGAFEETAISFAPTYKYVVGTNNFDNSERTPSYCDRILYSSNKGCLHQLEYSSIMDYTISDHKPVIGKFELTTPLVSIDKRRELVEKQLKDWDQEENAQRPVVTVEPREISKKCKVLQPAEDWITLTHDKESASGLVQWEIVICDNSGQELNHASVDHSTILAEPESGILPCGASQHIRLSCTPGVGCVALSQIAIVKIHSAQEIFVPIEFQVVETCLGKTLEELAGSKGRGKVPQEIWSCVEYLLPRVVPDTFSQAGDESIKAQIQEWLDTNTLFDEMVLEAANKVNRNIGVYSVAQQLVVVLQHIPDRIISSEKYGQIYKSYVAGSSAVHAAIDQMPGLHSNVLIYLVGFLHKVIVEGGCEEQLIIELFEPLLIGSVKGPKIDILSRDKRKKRREFVRALIYSPNN